MSSYFVTGVSRGIGFEFLKQLSNDPANTVIGLVRDKTATEAKIAAEISGRSNIHLVESDITDYAGLERVKEETSKITGGKLDYIIANAAIVTWTGGFDGIGDLGKNPEELESTLVTLFKTNVVANIHLFNIFMPLIMAGKEKKVITISTGLADLELTRKHDLHFNVAYTISKVAMNAAVAKFSAQYASQGVLFLSICPGMVDTGHNSDLTPEEQPKLMGVAMKFQQYAPHFTGPSTPESAVKDVRSVFEKASLANGDGGAFLSHLGNQQWL